MSKEKREKYVPKPTTVTVRKGGQKVMKDGKLLEAGGTESPEEKKGPVGEHGSPTKDMEVKEDGKR